MGEDGAFYMGDYVCSDKGGLKEIRFDKVYLSEDQKKKEKNKRKDKNIRWTANRENNHLGLQANIAVRRVFFCTGLDGFKTF